MAGPSRISLCGRLEVELAGRRLEESLPGRQGRLVLAQLALSRHRPLSRGELMDALWPADPPADPDEALSSLLSKLRRALGPGVLEGRQELTLVLPEDTEIDVETALRSCADAEASTDPDSAWTDGAHARDILERGLLAGDDSPWLDDRRRELEDVRLRALECMAEAGLAAGRAQLPGAEQVARALVDAAPFRESGRRLLMQVLAARGNTAEALQVYDRLRVLLRDELGTAPDQSTQALHRRLLEGGAEPVPHPTPPPRRERKLVTVLAAEAAGLDSLDAEEMHPRLTRWREELREEAEPYGGTVAPHVAGGLVFFGVPAAHEDDPERAVKVALRLRERRLAERVSISTGEVLVEEGGMSGGPLNAAMGLLQAAPPDGVVADEPTAGATRHVVEYTALGEVWLATAVRTRPRRARRAELVGRDHELALLQGAQRATVDEGRPRAIAILGPAGIGKTRLTDELVARSDAAVHYGRCLAYGEGITYWALREILWSAAGITLDDSAAAASAKLHLLVNRLIPAATDAERVTAALAITAGIPMQHSPLEQSSPETVADELGIAWPRFLSALAAEAPTIVVVEDLHWAERPLLDMVDRVAARSTGALLLVTSARPEVEWEPRGGVSKIVLEPLTDSQSAEMVEQLLPDAEKGLRERVVATAEGNPFFTEEIARHVGDEGAAEIPDTVRAVLAARIDALPEAQKRTLQDAAAVGRTFWATALESMAPELPVREALRSLEEKGLVVTRAASSFPGQTQLMFRHGLTREVAYRSIPRARRCRAHADVGRWIEELAGDRRDEFADLLAFHYEAAARPEDAELGWAGEEAAREEVRAKAVTALLDAGRSATRRVALDQAARFADRALALATRDEERLTANELKGRTFHAAVKGDEALAAYLEAIELAKGLGDERTHSRVRALALLLCARYMGSFVGSAWKEQALRLLDDALREVDLEETTFEVGAVLVAKSWGKGRWDDIRLRDSDTAHEEAVRAVEIAEAIDSPYLLGNALECLTWVVFERGWCEAGPMGERLLRSGGRLGDSVEAHEGVVTAAICFARAGRWEEARATAAQASAEAVRMGPHRALHAAAAEAIALVPTGHFAELLEATVNTLELAEEEGERICSSGIVGVVGRIVGLHEAGDRHAAEKALALLELNASREGPADYEYFDAELLRPCIGLERARLAVRRVRPRALASNIQRLRTELQLQAVGREWDTLPERIAEARAMAGPSCAPPLRHVADWAEAMLLAGAGRQAEALTLARESMGSLRDYGQRYTAERLLVDLLPLLEGEPARELAGETAERLAAMGALTSAAEARALA